MLRLAVGLIALLASSCAHTFAPLDVSKLPDAKTYPNDAWVTLLDEVTISFDVDPKTKEPIARVVRQLRRRMLKPRPSGVIQASYDRTFSEVVSVQARYVLPDGTSHDIDTSKRVDVSAAPGIFFDESRYVLVTPPALPAGAVLESRTEWLQRNLEPWVHHSLFGDDEPVESMRVVVTAPKGWEIGWRCSALGVPQAFEPVVTQLEKTTQWVFERSKIAPTRTEPSGPSLADEVPMLLVRLEKWVDRGEAKAALPTATALSKWLYPRYDERAQPDDDIKKKVKEVLATVPDEPRAKAKALYEFACRSVQYCAIEVGYGAWIPHDARDVHSKRYGDCKDKANYLRTLLKVAGIESYPTLIYAHRGFPHGFQVASLGANFNHAILAVKLGNETIYADPTWRAVPFGEVPHSDRGATVLQLTPEGAELAKTPESDPAHNLEEEHYTLNVSESGDGKGSFEVTAQGLNAVSLSEQQLRSFEKASKWMNDRLTLHSTEIDGLDFKEGGEFSERVVVTGALKVQRLLSRNDNGVGLLRLSDVLPTNLGTLDDGERRTPFVAQYLSTRRTQFTLQLPPSVRISHLPAATHLDTPFLTYDLSWKSEGQALVATRAVFLKQRIVPPSEAKGLLASLDALKVAEAEAVVVRSSKEAP